MKSHVTVVTNSAVVPVLDIFDVVVVTPCLCLPSFVVVVNTYSAFVFAVAVLNHSYLAQIVTMFAVYSPLSALKAAMAAVKAAVAAV